MMEDAELNNPYLAAGRGAAGLGLDAQFAQMERQGEFKNLPGAGKPYSEIHGSGSNPTHFGGDSLDQWVERYAAKHGVQPRSTELRQEYMKKLKQLRSSLRSIATGHATRAMDGRRFEYELEQLSRLRTDYDSEVLKDSLSYSRLGSIVKLPVP